MFLMAAPLKAGTVTLFSYRYFRSAEAARKGGISMVSRGRIFKKRNHIMDRTRQNAKKRKLALRYLNVFRFCRVGGTTV